jgi:hypothetical protein
MPYRKTVYTEVDVPVRQCRTLDAEHLILQAFLDERRLSYFSEHEQHLHACVVLKQVFHHLTGRDIETIMDTGNSSTARTNFRETLRFVRESRTAPLEVTVQGFFATEEALDRVRSEFIDGSFVQVPSPVVTRSDEMRDLADRTLPQCIDEKAAFTGGALEAALLKRLQEGDPRRRAMAAERDSIIAPICIDPAAAERQREIAVSATPPTQGNCEVCLARTAAPHILRCSVHESLE